MGRLYVDFEMVTAVGGVRGKARVDSGADYTILSYEGACMLGLDPTTTETGMIGGLGGSQTSGFILPVRVRVGLREADVDAFVPIYQILRKTKTGKLRTKKVPDDLEPLIGHDFLQASRANLTYSMGHPAFSGAYWDPFEWHRVPISREAERLLRKVKPCR